MKTKTIRRKPASVAKTRWTAYAAAGAATALVGSNAAEAAIHYSGDLHEQFGPHKEKIKTFPLDQAGDDFLFERTSYADVAAFNIFGIVSNAFRGFGPNYLTISKFYVSRLPKGVNISSGHFTQPGVCCYPPYGFLDSRSAIYQSWKNPGIGFVGFRFNNGAGVQYGWVRVRMSKLSQNAFAVLDYAYADPGEPITAGQRSSNEQAPYEGSLGWLAAGAVGLLVWRKGRSQTTR